MSLILMSLGPFRFSINTFSYERIKRSTAARIESQKVIGSRPSLHFMGQDDETIRIRSTFFPFHLPGNAGLAQLATMRQSVGASYPLIGVQGQAGDVLGRWALDRVGDTGEHIGPEGTPQQVEVDIDLIFDGRPRSAEAISLLGQVSPALGTVNAAVRVIRTGAGLTS